MNELAIEKRTDDESLFSEGDIEFVEQKWWFTTSYTLDEIV